MIEFVVFVVAIALLAGSPAWAAERPTGGRIDVSAIHAAVGDRPVRVIVELAVGDEAAPREIRRAQRAVVSDVFGADAWRRRDTGDEPHGLATMSFTPAFAATVRPNELDRLAAHPMVRGITPDGLSRPTDQGLSSPH